MTPESTDIDRKELPWETREETLLKEWKIDCNERSVNHDIVSKKNKIKFAICGTPTVLVPIILSGIGSVAPCNSLIFSIGMMISGIFSGMNLFFNFGKKIESNLSYSAKFFELATEIEMELAKPKRFRVDCSVFMERIKLLYNSLCKQAPA
jgi:hypothetical protein